MNLHRLVEKGLLKEVTAHEQSRSDGRRQRFWALSLLGARVLRAEARSADLPDELTGLRTSEGGGTKLFPERQAQIDAFKHQFLVRALKIHGGDVAAAAVASDVPKGTFYRLLKKHGIQPRSFRTEGLPFSSE